MSAGSHGGRRFSTVSGAFWKLARVRSGQSKGSGSKPRGQDPFRLVASKGVKKPFRLGPGTREQA